MLLKNLMTNKLSMNSVNDDQRNFVFDLMKGYNVSSFFKKSETKDLSNRNFYEKSKLKGNPNSQDILTESYKYYIIITVSNTKISKTHRLLNKILLYLSVLLSVYYGLRFLCLPSSKVFFSSLNVTSDHS